ncbi:MAG: hypothetical protein ACI9MR_004569 [Myxococcota bacterium]|jgi:hypothetical protein
MPDANSLRDRFKPFIDAGLIQGIPTPWQLALGAIEMAPYVIMPDDGDKDRYSGALLGNPLLRQPIIFAYVGRDHMRIGHGLDVSPKSQRRHLNFVFHEGMPVYDLQLVQTHPDGLEELRRAMMQLEEGTLPQRAWQRRMIDLVIPDASSYRRRFVEPGGYIDRALAFDYPPLDGVAEFLRPEFTSLTTFIDYCLESFEPARDPKRPWHTVREVADLATRRLRNVGFAA